jgi:penicillin-binding protein 1A
VKKLRLLAILAAARAAGDRLDRLRDDDGGRVRPARPREPQGVPGRAQLGAPTHRASTLGVLTNNQSRVLVRYGDISPYMRNAIIAIEDRRFYENSGVDLRGIGRALVQDVLQRKTVQGGSTIAQQFVKNALQAQSNRTVFQKMREAALAYHLTRKCPRARSSRST